MRNYVFIVDLYSEKIQNQIFICKIKTFQLDFQISVHKAESSHWYRNAMLKKFELLIRKMTCAEYFKVRCSDSMLAAPRAFY